MSPLQTNFITPRLSLANRIRTTNPLVGIRRAENGLFRVAPKVNRTSTDRARQAAENMATYHPDIDRARDSAAEMIRRYRNQSWGLLSAMTHTRLQELNRRIEARMTEFGALRTVHFDRDTPAVDYVRARFRAEDDYNRNSYRRRGSAIGALTGGALGTGIGAVVGHRKGRMGAGAAIGAGAGLVAGSLAGENIGGNIRSKPDPRDPKFEHWLKSLPSRAVIV